MLSFLKKKLTGLVRYALEKHWTNVVRSLPNQGLQEKHLAHLKALTDREALLSALPKNGICAELGVNRGDFSARILALAVPSRLHLIDTWEQAGLRQQVEQKLAVSIGAKQVVLHAGYSTDVAEQFADGYFDWIYIDTDHSYATTKAELEQYAPKMKPGGIIAGHDFIVGNWNGSVRYGVIEAVYEFCLHYNWEMIYLTMNQPEYPSFAIRRIP